MFLSLSPLPPVASKAPSKRCSPRCILGAIEDEPRFVPLLGKERRSGVQANEPEDYGFLGRRNQMKTKNETGREQRNNPKKKGKRTTEGGFDYQSHPKASSVLHSQLSSRFRWRWWLSGLRRNGEREALLPRVCNSHFCFCCSFVIASLFVRPLCFFGFGSYSFALPTHFSARNPVISIFRKRSSFTGRELDY